MRPLGITARAWWRAYHQRQPDNVLRLPELAEQLAARGTATTAQLHQALRNEIGDCAWFAYPDAVPFIEHWQKRAQLYVLAVGELKLQQQKLATCGVPPEVGLVAETPERIEQALPFAAVERAIFLAESPGLLRELAGTYRWSGHLLINRAGRTFAEQPFPELPNLAAATPALGELLNAQGARVHPDPITD